MQFICCLRKIKSSIWSRWTTICALLLLGCSIFNCSYTAAAVEVVFPEISAQSAVVFDTDSERVLYEKNGDKRMRIASTTKILTAIVILENCNLDDIVAITTQHYAEGSSMYLKEGEEVSVQDLLYGLLLMSGNDAALALAYHCSGGPDQFADLMNAKAVEIGMNDSSFRNPNGLDIEGHYSTAKDMAQLASYCMKNNDFRRIVGTKSGSFARRNMTNNNKLLHRLKGCTGLKTGYTKAAGRCLISSVKRNGHETVVVTLNAPNDWNDHTILHNRAFDAYERIEIGLAGMTCTGIPTQNGQYPRVLLSYTEDCITWAAEGEKVSTKIYADRFVYAPVRAGDHAGEIAVLIDDIEILRVPLVFSSDIEAINAETGLFDRFIRHLIDVVSGTSF